jgi:hypothetical protein
VSLKASAADSDTPAMFFSLAPAPDPAATRLGSLYAALNAPVVAIGDLPMGPARAAIAALAAAHRPAWWVVAVRSIPTGEVFFFEAEPGVCAAALDAAISFAGSMGFLFDESEAEEAADAARLWDEWLGRAVQRPGRGAVATAASPMLAAAPAVSRDVPLTKFRRASDLIEGF